MLRLVAARYSVMSNTKAQADGEGFSSLIKNGDVNGLEHLVINILSIEAGMQECSQKDRFMFMQIISEELEAAGVPSEAAHTPPSDF